MTIKNAILSTIICIAAITPHKFLAALGASVIAVSSVSAQSTWSGSTNGNWDEAANWDTAPGNGDALTFSGTSNQTNTNDTTLANIGLLTLNGAGWDINLGTLTLNSGITANGNATLDGSLALGAAQTWQNAAGTLSITGTAANGGNLLGISGIGNTTIGSLISGTGGLTKSGAGTLTLSDANTYSGTTTVSDGTLNLTGNRTANAGEISIENGGTLGISNGNFSIGNNTFRVGRTAGTSTVNHTAGNISTGTGGDQVFVGTLRNGIYNLSGGTLNINGTNNSRGIIIGLNSNSPGGTFNLSGTGILNMVSTSSLQIGRSDFPASNTSTAFNQTGGTANIGILRMGGNTGGASGVNATLSITGGVFTAASFDRLAYGNTNTALIAIGGTADVTLPAFPSGALGSGSTATITFDGGLLKNSAASANYLGNISSVQIKDGGAFINSTAGNITITQALENFSGHTGSLTKQGSGTLTLSGENTYTGATTVNAGTLDIRGSIATSSGITNNADLVFNSSSAQAFANTIIGSGNLTKQGSGTLTLSGENTYTGATTINAGTLDVRGSITGSGITNNAVLVFNSSSAQAFANTISGSGSLTKQGSGTLTLSGENTYTDATTINAGTLAISTSGSIAGTTKVTLLPGATFDVSAAGFTFVSGQTIASGSSSGTANIDATGRALTLASGAIAAFDCVAGSSGMIFVTGDLALNNNVIMVNVTGAALTPGVYPLMECAGTLTGSALPGAVINGTPLAEGSSARIQTDAFEKRVNLLVADGLPPVTFSNLAASPVISRRDTSVVLSGTITGTGPLYPEVGEPVSVTIDGHTVIGNVTDGAGSFSVTYNHAALATLEVGSYPITYRYAGSASLAGALDDNTSLTVNFRVPAVSWSDTWQRAITYGTGLVRFDFDTPANLEGWATNAHLSINAHTNGTITATSVGNDPQFFNTQLYLQASIFDGLAISLTATNSGSITLFWGNRTSNTFSAERQATIAVSPSSVPQVVYFDMRNAVGWKGNVITRLRIDTDFPAGNPFQLHWVLLSDGDYDRDGIHDIDEGVADIDGNGIPNFMDPDSVGDGVSDFEAMRRGWNPYDPLAGTIDSDGDGISDAHEILAGTDPTDPTDYPNLFMAVTNATDLVVGIDARQGRSYRLFSRTNLIEGAWTATNVAQQAVSDQSLTWEFSEPTAGPRFFRMQIQGHMEDPIAFPEGAPTAETLPDGDAILDNGLIRVRGGVANGASLNYLSVAGGPNLINVYDQGRLIQQSYYAGQVLDRRAEGQHTHWSPWSWNPIQGGDASDNVADVLAVKPVEFGAATYTRTVPLLWDMTTGERGQCVMDQWNTFEPGMPNVIRVTCRFIVNRDTDDIWGGPVNRHQELPATYFIRSLSKVVSYTNSVPWTEDATSVLDYAPGPPWVRAWPTEHWIAQVDPATDTGVGVYSPIADSGWWYGGVGGNTTGDATSSRTMHMAPLATVALNRRSVLVYRYWMIFGNLTEIRETVYELRNRYPHG